jgi:hypothetical protein
MPLMSYLDQPGAFGNKLHAFPFRLSCVLALEANRNSTMQIGFPGRFIQPLGNVQTKWRQRDDAFGVTYQRYIRYSV